jgi:dynein-related subfamily AAA family protein
MAKNPKGGAPRGGAGSRSARNHAELLRRAEQIEAAEPGPGRDAGQNTDSIADMEEVTGPATPDRLRRAIGQAETARKRADARYAALDKRQDKLDADLARLAEDRAEHDWRLDDLQRREEAVDADEKRLTEARERLAGLEQEARRGFAAYRREQLDALQRELDERRADFERDQREAEAERDGWRAQRRQELLAARAELEEREGALDRKELEHRRLERRLSARAEHLGQEVDDRIREKLAGLQTELELARQQAAGCRQEADAMRDLAERRAAELARFHAAEAELNGMSLPAVVERLGSLDRENRDLRDALTANPLKDREKAAELEARLHDLLVEREEMLRQNTQLRRHVTASMISATERENAHMINKALERQNKVLTEEIDQQSRKLMELTSRITDSPPFPACSGMDENETYQVTPSLDGGPIQLRDFVARVRVRLATDLKLYYSEADLRCFVAGLAASRLHLLQGISGIGKTRLPEAFAQIIGAGRQTVAVAAEWRSPQDLLGYYNPFEHKFYETEFTQSLYRARLPLFRDKPFIVVLDEMNLSHPEQYFSDLLSAMERKESDPHERQLLQLMTAPASPAPRLLHDGRALELPDNVWFIGTANNDETTVRFAEKTYDRAHVLELPPKPLRFSPSEARPLTPVSYKSLMDAFHLAEKADHDGTDKVLTFLDDGLGDRLRGDFGVSWGSRLERQARRFVPVTVAAGGDLGEAADHLLATKVLRKLIGRVEIAPAELRELRSEVEALWPAAFSGTAPAKSLRLLDGEIRSLGIG